MNTSFSIREQIFELIKKRYGSEPEYLWMRFPDYAVFRHKDNRRWFALVMDVPRSNLGLKGTVPLEEIGGLIDTSYAVTASSAGKRKLLPPREWIVPANPRYYDILHAFDSGDEISWKQGRGIRTGDTVYIYAAAPVSAILYRCRVTSTGIPFSYSGGSLSIKELMRIRLERRYDPGLFTFSVLKDHYGIGAVMGPRGVPGTLSEALNMEEE